MPSQGVDWSTESSVPHNNEQKGVFAIRNAGSPPLTLVPLHLFGSLEAVIWWHFSFERVPNRQWSSRRLSGGLSSFLRETVLTALTEQSQVFNIISQVLLKVLGWFMSMEMFVCCSSGDQLSGLLFLAQFGGLNLKAVRTLRFQSQSCLQIQSKSCISLYTKIRKTLIKDCINFPS